jgi:hypothetical protein
MKKYIVKYTLEFLVIVLGISVSFYINEVRKSRELVDLSKNIQKNLLNEVYDIEKYIQEREAVFSLDKKAISSIINLEISPDSLIQLHHLRKFNLISTIFNYRGFKPPASVYNSIINDGSLRYLESLSVKEELDKMHNVLFYFITENIEDEKIAKNKIVEYVQIHYPDIYLNLFTKKIENLKKFKKIIRKDPTLRAFVFEKGMTMGLKNGGIKKYKNSLEKIKNVLLKKEL